jgi:hypothetical protein
MDKPTVQRLPRKEAELAQLVQGVDVYPDHPSSSPCWEKFECLSSSYYNYNRKIKGYLVPPQLVYFFRKKKITQENFRRTSYCCICYISVRLVCCLLTLPFHFSLDARFRDLSEKGHQPCKFKPQKHFRTIIF